MMNLVYSATDFSSLSSRLTSQPSIYSTTHNTIHSHVTNSVNNSIHTSSPIKPNAETLIAYDYSGSTAGNKNYHQIAAQIASNCDQDNTNILLWSGDAKYTTFEKLAQINQQLIGSGGTDIDVVAKTIIKDNFNGKLILITDGQVGTNSIDVCDTILQNREFTSVEVYIIGNCANMSVSCPFTRNCPHIVKTYDHNMSVTETVITEADIQTLTIIDSINDEITFVNKFDSILKALTARMMGRNDTDMQIHDQIVRMQKRILADISAKKTLNEQDTIKELLDAAKVGDGIDLYTNLVNNHYLSSDKSFDLKIGELLNISKGGLRTCFSHQLRRAEVQSMPTEVTITEEQDDNRGDFQCPISLDNESDIALLIKSGKPILDDIDSKMLDQLILCPLAALNNKFICNEIMQRFDVPLGVSSIIIANGFDKSPLTRDNIMGPIYLGCNISQTYATKYTIAQMLTSSGVRIGNMDIWFIVICILIKKINRFDDIRFYVEKKMKYVMENCITRASLTGNSQYLMIKVPLDLSFWMIFTSPLLKLPAKQDMSRAHVWYMDTIYELLEIAGYTLSAENKQKLVKHHKRVRAIMKIMSINNLQNILVALSQPCIDIEGTYVPIDGENVDETIADKVLKKLNIDLPREEICQLAKYTKELSIDWEPTPNVNESKLSWPCYGFDQEDKYEKLVISVHTCRPLYMIGQKSWEIIAKDLYGDSYISMNESFGKYVIKYKKYPNVNDIILFVMDYYLSRGKHSLPAPIINFAKTLIEENAECMRLYSPEEFARRFELNRCRKTRCRNETL